MEQDLAIAGLAALEALTDSRLLAALRSPVTVVRARGHADPQILVIDGSRGPRVSVRAAVQARVVLVAADRGHSDSIERGAAGGAYQTKGKQPDAAHNCHVRARLLGAAAFEGDSFDANLPVPPSLPPL